MTNWNGAAPRSGPRRSDARISASSRVARAESLSVVPRMLLGAQLVDASRGIHRLSGHS
jgi:hypothetical protein